MLLYREDLERLGCSATGCTETHREGEIYFHSQCHLDAPTWVHYRADVLTIECSVCRKHIASIVVASRDAHDRGLDGT